MYIQIERGLTSIVPPQLHGLAWRVKKCRIHRTSCRIFCQSADAGTPIPADACTRRAALATGSAFLASAMMGQGNDAVAQGGSVEYASKGSAISSLAAVPRATIAPTLEVSQVIKGCWQLSGGHRGDKATDRTAGAAAVEDIYTFVSAGIDTLDCADHYGDAEAIIGMYQGSASPGAKATVLTKACVWGQNLAKAGRGSILEREYIDVSRDRLGQSQLDLLQFYWHDYNQPQYVDAALKLVDMQQKGKLRNIGLTNFDVPRVQQLVEAGVPVVSHQAASCFPLTLHLSSLWLIRALGTFALAEVAYSLLDRRPQNGMAEYCKSRGISLLPYGVVAGGLLSDKYLEAAASDVAFNTASKRKYASVLSTVGGWSWFQRLLKTLHGVATKHGVSIANVASRWVLDQPAVGAIILGARNANHVEDHRALFSFSMDGADYDAINDVLADARRPTSDCYSWERGGVF